MTYNPFTRTLWQVNVGGDNCIYELDPATKIATGNKMCPAFGTSERGLAFDPLTNTYYAGSWNDGILNHFAPDGTIIDSAAVNLNISGLAFNPGTGHLFVMTNNTHTVGVYDVYVLDTKNAYNILGAFNIYDAGVDVFATGGPAGVEMVCSGNFWVVYKGTQKVYVADSGETDVCNWQAPWLNAAPTSGSVAISGSTPLTVSVDATGLPVGADQGYLRFVGNTPNGDEIVPVTLNITLDPTAPVVNTFTVTTPSNSLNIPITAFSAMDDIGVTGYLIIESATAPVAGAAGWTATAPTIYTVAADGSYTLYPWAKDAAGNVSAVFASPRTVVVDTVAPIPAPPTLPAWPSQSPSPNLSLAWI